MGWRKERHKIINRTAAKSHGSSGISQAGEFVIVQLGKSTRQLKVLRNICLFVFSCGRKPNLGTVDILEAIFCQFEKHLNIVRYNDRLFM